MNGYSGLSTETARKQSKPEVETGLSAAEVVSRLQIPEDSTEAQAIARSGAESFALTTRHFLQYDFHPGKPSADVVNYQVAAESVNSGNSTRLFDISKSSEMTSEQVDLARAGLPKPDYSGIPWLQARIQAATTKA